MRTVAQEAVHRGAAWAAGVGAIGPDDRRARRFRSMGAGSIIGWPQGPVFGERLIRIGAGTMIGPYVSMAVGMGPDEPVHAPDGTVIRIGDRCMIGRGNFIIGRLSIIIGSDVTTAPNVYITDHNHTYDDLRIPIGKQWPVTDPVTIGDGCWLGTNVVVLPGADIGRHVAVAAGSVVRGQIPDNCVIAGAPARVVRRYTDEDGWTPPRAATPVPDWWIVE